jgi:predicted  nucleic acid-binding Zn-ribbon protein
VESDVRRIASIAVLAAALLAPAGAAHAASIGTLQAQVSGARAQARQLAGTVQMRNAQFQAAASDAVASARRLTAIESELAHGRQRVAAIQARVNAATARLHAAQARLRREQNTLASRLVAIYKSGAPNIASMLLDSTSFSDLLTRESYLKRINDADSALVHRVQDLRNRVRAALAQVQALRAAAQAEVDRIASARAQAAQVRKATAAKARAAASARASAQSALSALHSRIAGWTSQVAALQAATGQGGSAGGTVQQWVGDFAIPQSVVMCESGGNYGAVNPSSGAGGAYQMLPSTYKGLGGQYAAPQLAPKSEQDRLAAKLWAGGRGAGNWECAKK